MARHHLVEVGPGRLIPHLAEEDTIRPHPQAGLQQTLSRDTAEPDAALGVEEPHMVLMRHHQLERVLDRDQPLALGNGRDQRLPHGRLAAARGAAQQHGHAVADAGAEEGDEIARVIEGQHLGRPLLLALFPGGPLVPALGLVSFLDIGQRRHRAARPADRQADTPLRHRGRQADLQALPAGQLGRAERAPRPDILLAQRAGEDGDVLQVIVAERQVVTAELPLLPDEHLARPVDRNLFRCRIVQPRQNRLKKIGQLWCGFTAHNCLPSHARCRHRKSPSPSRQRLQHCRPDSFPRWVEY
jgi:hypothetical protein